MPYFFRVTSIIQLFRFQILNSLLFIVIGFSLSAQDKCRSFEYQQQEINNNPKLYHRLQAVEKFINTNNQSESFRTESSVYGQPVIIKIPVIVHIIYNKIAENVSDAQIKAQIAALNRDFRKKNADTSKIPASFKQFAADCEIEFVLATMDSKGRSTTGIIHKYSPVSSWGMDDKIKFSSEMGDDAWDANSYLNIWVGNIKNLLGYSSVVGGAPEKDGIVLNPSSLGTAEAGGRTAVHEVGHWLGLRHLWGDADCGDDMVDDTPKQRSYTVGCPTAIRSTCGNTTTGDMYNNYMDFTSDACLNMFTLGQKARMRKLFDAAGIRHSILNSKGLNISTIEQIALPERMPTWRKVKSFPNPATNTVNVNLEYDARWIGKEMVIVNMMGTVVMKQIITNTVQKIDISKLNPGVYFIKAEKEGEKMLEKIVKM